MCVCVFGEGLQDDSQQINKNRCIFFISLVPFLVSVCWVECFKRESMAMVQTISVNTKTESLFFPDETK